MDQPGNLQPDGRAKRSLPHLDQNHLQPAIRHPQPPHLPQDQFEVAGGDWVYWR